MILKRPPNDNFTFRLFYNLVRKIKVPKDVMYLWSPVLEPNYMYVHHFESTDDYAYEFEIDYRTAIIENIKKDLVVIGIKDHLTYGSYDFNRMAINTNVENLSCLFRTHKDKHFILFTSLENLDQCLSLDNVSIVPWGGDITNQEKEYKQLTPLTDKNFDSPYVYLNLNRGMRIQRAISVCLQFGLNLENYGMISAMFKDNLTVDELDRSQKLFDKNLEIFNTCKLGFQKLKLASLPINDDKNIYPKIGNDNVSNFKNKLAPYYTNTFIEVISETSYFEKYFLITEKTLNSIYGCCFPIFLSSYGTVDFLRNIGLDVFDDVIDHSYDLIDDPVERMYHAFYDNKDILSNLTNIKNIWKLNQPRFLRNVDFVKHELYNFYTRRASQNFFKILNHYKY
jgi:hypothetical protein